MVSIDREEYLFLGQVYQLRIVDDLPKAIILEDSLKISSVVLRNAADHLQVWYKEKALEYLNHRVGHYAKLTGVVHKAVRVSDARTRWGSCGYAGTLNFNWRLIMALPRVVDYVVVHELMHIKQRNHSSKFWNEVRNVIPDYKSDEQWLKNNRHRLTIE